MREFAISGETYRAGRLTPHQQFHCVRRLGPRILAPMALLKGDIETLADEDFALAVAPLLDAIGKMSNRDADYVLNTCLLAVHKKEGDKWMPVFIETGHDDADPSVPVGRFMYQQVDMMQMMVMVQNVLKGNLANFSQGQIASGA